MNNYTILIFVAGAMLLFTLGYVSHKVLGNNNPVEEVAEELLKNEYGIDVEFSGDK
jgi:hypothetical protein